MKGIFSLPDLSLRTFIVLYRNLIVFKKTWKTNITLNFIEPLMYLAAMGYGLGNFVHNMEGLPYLDFIAPGIVASSAMWATATDCTYDSFVRMKYQKTFQAIAATPATMDEVVAGEILYGVYKSVLYGSVILIVNALLGLVSSFWALFVPLVLVLNGFIFAELALIWTGIVAKIDSFSYFLTLIITPMFLFSGVFFPVSGLPKFAQIIAWFSPLYHVVELIRALSFGTIHFSLLYNAAVLILLSIIFFNPPIYIVKKRLIK